MSSPWSLLGQKVVVTGGSQGIGRATVHECVNLGAEVLAVARSADNIDSLVHHYRSLGLRVHGIAADLATPQGRTQLFDKVRELWGTLDLLVNNVGTNLRKDTLDFTTADMQSLFATNMESAWELCRGFFPLLTDGNGGAVVNVSSVAAARVVRTSTAVYAMTKAAMDQMTRFLAVEWGAKGVRVNAVQPWYIRTPLTASVLDDDAATANILSVTPLQRVGEPEDVARAICFLAMPAASYLNGVTLPVDGGAMCVGL